jgi:hypothetical protein
MFLFVGAVEQQFTCMQVVACVFVSSRCTAFPAIVYTGKGAAAKLRRNKLNVDTNHNALSLTKQYSTAATTLSANPSTTMTVRSSPNTRTSLVQ